MDVMPYSELYEPVQAGWSIAGVIISVGLSYLASLLLRRDQSGPRMRPDDTPTTIASRGAYVPMVIGRRRIGHVFGWAGNRKAIVTRQRSGGKGLGSGVTSESTTYEESGWHLLCIGPARTIHGIYANGKLIYGVPIVNDGSGITNVSTSEGDFFVYWGEQDQPVNEFLGRADRIGVTSRWPGVCSILWLPKKLGSSPQWPQIEYELSVGCPGSSLDDSDYDLDDGTSSGVNPAHAIYQLLTAPRPWGCGIDLDLIDKTSLEAMGVKCETEHLPVNLLIEDGKTAADAMADILADTGYMLTQVDGRLYFAPIREPTESVPEFDTDTTSPPLPEIDIAHEPTHGTRRVYLFTNEDANYRDYDIKLDDDGNADESYREEEVRLATVTHGEVAAKVAARREAESYGDGGSISLTVLRGGRLLYPGQSIDVTDVGRCRVVGVNIDVNTPGAQIDATLDAYAVPTAGGDFEGGVAGPDPLDPEADLAFTWFEVPESAGATREGLIVVFRIHAHEQIEGALVHGSIDGGTSYTEIGRQDQPAAGGTLLDALASGASDVENGPIVEALDALTSDVLDLSASTANWEAGQQLAVFESEDGTTREVTYLRNVSVQSESEWVASTAYSVNDAVIPTADAIQTGLRYVCTTAGTSGTTEPTWPTDIGDTVNDNGVVWEARYFRYQLHGIKRAQYGTTDQAFSADDRVYIIEQDSLSIISHSIIQPGETLCVKTQPLGNGTSVALSGVTAVCDTVDGFGT